MKIPKNLKPLMTEVTISLNHETLRFYKILARSNKRKIETIISRELENKVHFYNTLRPDGKPFVNPFKKKQ